MAANSYEQGKPHSMGSKDGNENSAVKSSSFQSTNGSFDKSDQQCSLDILPLLVKEASILTGEGFNLRSPHGQEVCTVSISPDEDNTSVQCASQFYFPSFLKALFHSKNHLFLDAQLNCQKAQTCINLLLEGADAYGSYAADNAGKGNSQTAKSREESVTSMKMESVHTQKVLQRQSSLNTEKAVPERSSSNRWRRYKRAASFDSRKIVIFFSVLSSIGTLILIYLTLRVKQSGGEFHQD